MASVKSNPIKKHAKGCAEVAWACPVFVASPEVRAEDGEKRFYVKQNVDMAIVTDQTLNFKRFYILLFYKLFIDERANVSERRMMTDTMILRRSLGEDRPVRFIARCRDSDSYVLVFQRAKKVEWAPCEGVNHCAHAVLTQFGEG